MLFAYSTMITWSYYGLEGVIYIFGPGKRAKLIFNAIFCLFIVMAVRRNFDAVLNFSDAMIFAMALANVLALYFLAPVVKKELHEYWQRLRAAHSNSFIKQLVVRRLSFCAAFVRARKYCSECGSGNAGNRWISS